MGKTIDCNILIFILIKLLCWCFLLGIFRSFYLFSRWARFYSRIQNIFCWIKWFQYSLHLGSLLSDMIFFQVLLYKQMLFYKFARKFAVQVSNQLPNAAPSTHARQSIWPHASVCLYSKTCRYTMTGCSIINFACVRYSASFNGVTAESSSFNKGKRRLNHTIICPAVGMGSNIRILIWKFLRVSESEEMSLLVIPQNKTMLQITWKCQIPCRLKLANSDEKINESAKKNESWKATGNENKAKMGKIHWIRGLPPKVCNHIIYSDNFHFQKLETLAGAGISSMGKLALKMHRFWSSMQCARLFSYYSYFLFGSIVLNFIEILTIPRLFRFIILFSLVLVEWYCSRCFQHSWYCRKIETC